MVPVGKLDTIVGDRNPALMKIDVEGYETEVLAGADKVLKLASLKAIIIELNGSGSNYGYDEKNIHQLLLKHEFRPYLYDPGKRVLSIMNNFGTTNTIYLKDPEFVSERVTKAEPVKILEQQV